jgi:hypothetical protein
MDGMGSANVFDARLGQTEEAYFSFTHEIADGPGDILDRHGPVHPMLVEQIDVIDTEREERCVGDLTDVFGPTIGSEGRGPRKAYTKFVATQSAAGRCIAKPAFVAVRRKQCSHIQALRELYTEPSLPAQGIAQLRYTAFKRFMTRDRSFTIVR